jgi:hypothetical protein
VLMRRARVKTHEHLVGERPNWHVFRNLGAPNLA